MAEVTIAKAYRNDVRISTRKVQIVLDLIRGKEANVAVGILKNTRKSASEYAIKILKEAMPRAQGRAFRILKRTSHITICVKEKE